MSHLMPHLMPQLTRHLITHLSLCREIALALRVDAV